MKLTKKDREVVKKALLYSYFYIDLTDKEKKEIEKVFYKIKELEK